MSNQAFTSINWENLFVDSLRKIQKKTFPELDSDDEALIFIEELLKKLLKQIIDKNPHSFQDLEKIVNSILPQPINDYFNKKVSCVLNECSENNHDTSSINLHTSPNSPFNSSTMASGRRKKIASLVNITNFSNFSNNSSTNNLSANCSQIMQKVIEQIFCKDVFSFKLDLNTFIYLCSLLEYIAIDIFNLVKKYLVNMGTQQIKLQDVKIALNADILFMDLFYGEKEKLEDEEHPFFLIDGLNFSEADDKSTGDNVTLSYDDIVKDFLKEEKLFLRDLNLILKVFREPFIRLLTKPSKPNTPTIPINNSSLNGCNNTLMILNNDCESIINEKQIDSIFSNITDIHEFVINFISLIEDTLEMNEENEGIGNCFEEMAESLEFEVFEKFAKDLFKNSKQEGNAYYHLMELFKDQQVVSCLSTVGQGVLLCIKYVLPKFLIGIVVHCIHYFEYIKLFMNSTPSKEDKESFRQCKGLLNLLKGVLEKETSGKNLRINEGYLRLTRTHKEKQIKSVKTKIEEIKKLVEGFHIQDCNQYCNEFIYEGLLYKARKVDKKGIKNVIEKRSQRYCFLFDNILICCKPFHNLGNNFEYKKKEIFYIRKIKICDNDSEFNSFELLHKEKINDPQQVTIFLANSQEEKNIWISNLLLLSQKSILERTLDSILSEEEKRIPLELPSPDKYRFAEKDLDSNIVFDCSTGKELIKAATLTKLIERLTYHQFADPMFLKIFLTTYRSFCSPEQLLDLLIERFNIPSDDSITLETNNLSREKLKRFKKEYLEPIQLRVLNVMKHWVENHFYDLDESMKTKLNDFLLDLQEKKKKKNFRKWVDNLVERIKKKEEQSEEKKEKFLSESLPAIEYWFEREKNQFNLLTVHPLEFGRQLTLYEFDLYCAVKPFELMGAKWTKKDKNNLSPNLIKLMQHNSRFIFYIEKEIVECPNLEERQVIVNRLVEILQVLVELNNFNGIIEIISALKSASVHRLELTLESLSKKSVAYIDELNQLINGHFQKYQEKLRSIDPPCVPFFGLYLTQILHLEEGNQDYVDTEKQLINFSKRRKIAEITNEIQQYQNQPYCLQVYPNMQEFISNIDPLESKSEKDFVDYLYNKSLEIEPRDYKQLLKGERKYKDIQLKSPGIKPSAQNLSSSSTLSNLTSLNHHFHQCSLLKISSNYQTSNSNPQTPTHTPSSSTPTSPTLVLPTKNSSENGENQHMISENSLSPNLIINKQRNFSFENQLKLKKSFLNCSDKPPPLPPRSKKISLNSIHKRTTSDSSSASTNSPNFHLHSALNTPFSNVSSVFTFSHPPPPPPRIHRFQDFNESNINPSSPNQNLLLNSINYVSEDKPPPLPPRSKPL